MSSNRDIYELLEKLCKDIAGKNHRAALKSVTQYLSNCPNALCSKLQHDESTIVSNITSYLSSKSSNDAMVFMRFHEQLSTRMDIHQRNSILTFLLRMADSDSNIRLQSEIASLAGLVHPSPNNTKTSMFIKPESSQQIEKLFPQNNQRPTLATSASTSSSENNIKLTQIRPSSRTISQSSTPRIESGSSDLLDELVQDAIYAFIGVQGKYLRKDVISGGFKLDPAKGRSLNATNAGMLLRLAELGYLHDQVSSYTDPQSGRCPIGLLGQGLVSAMKKELTQYYGMVASLQEQVKKQRQIDINDWGNNKIERITMMKVMLWVMEPMHRLQWLATIAQACQDEKGGALASAVYNFQSHGDPRVKSLAKELLLALCGPLQHMFSRWILDGEIEDPHSEFFIEILPEVTSDRLWHDKYRVCEALLPNFISKSFANKILVTGKSINFLREVCQDKSPIKGRDELKQCFESNVENLFSPLTDTKLHIMIDNYYLSTSKKVLEIIMGPHKLLEHLQAMRRYLLLGQGDFIGLLMESLKPELDRPAKELLCYNLSAILNETVRSTNAQFEDPEILNHLEVRIMDSFDGDLGWDIFMLQYTVQSPLSTMLEPSMAKYKMLFKPLLRTKHIEFVLSSKIWKDQMCNAKHFRSMQKELNPISYRLHLYTSEMIHFINQIQYYILFEVIECSWSNLLKQVQEASAIDDILKAHHDFLEEIKVGIFLDEKNASLSGNLETVYTTIMKLEKWQDNFYEICNKELESRKKYETYIVKSENKGKYGVTAEKRLERDEELKNFEQSLHNCLTSLDKIRYDSEYAVRQFLFLLAKSNNYNLQLFGIRLDFNEYYKKRDQRLNLPLTFEHMRMSNMFQNSRNASVMNSSRLNATTANGSGIN